MAPATQQLLPPPIKCLRERTQCCQGNLLFVLANTWWQASDLPFLEQNLFFFFFENQLPSVFLEKFKNPAELVMINTALGQLCLCWRCWCSFLFLVISGNWAHLNFTVKKKRNPPPNSAVSCWLNNSQMGRWKCTYSYKLSVPSCKHPSVKCSLFGSTMVKAVHGRN